MSSANPSSVTDKATADECRIRSISWRDWKRLAVLFRCICPELKPKAISYYIRYYGKAIAVAEIRKELVGFYQFIPREPEGIAWLNYLGILPSHYRAGVGSLLLRDYETKAARMGFRWAEFDVLQQNLKAIRFYEKHGYTREHPVDNKFRYRKRLAVERPVSAEPQLTRPPSYPERIGNRLLYLVLVTLPLMFGDF